MGLPDVLDFDWVGGGRQRQQRIYRLRRLLDESPEKALVEIEALVDSGELGADDLEALGWVEAVDPPGRSN